MTEWVEGPPTKPGFYWIACAVSRRSNLWKSAVLVEASRYDSGLVLHDVTTGLAVPDNIEHHMPVPTPELPGLVVRQ